MTLDELLALIPDSPQGNISAADLRTIVTELHGLASTFRIVYPFGWKLSGTPQPTGDVTMDVPWSMSATKLLVSETALDGTIPAWGSFEDATDATFTLHTADGAEMTGTINGPSVDQGTYREFPITPGSQEGTPPSGGEKISLIVNFRIED